MNEEGQLTNAREFHASEILKTDGTYLVLLSLDGKPCGEDEFTIKGEQIQPQGRRARCRERFANDRRCQQCVVFEPKRRGRKEKNSLPLFPSICLSSYPLLALSFGVPRFFRYRLSIAHNLT